jgi:hypothetical protein
MVREGGTSRVAGPVFVGGTGRSGTTVLGELVGQHSAYHLIPHEVQFHCERRGLPGVLSGELGPRPFRERMIGHYYRRELAHGGVRGLHRLGVDGDVFERAVDEFLAGDPTDVAGAARLVSRTLDPLCRGTGARTWVEMTPRNVVHAGLLQRMFPHSKLLHIVRDGRDVAASVVTKWWGPDDPFDALRWWGDLLRTAEADPAPPGYVLVVGFERLLVDDRSREYRRIREFLGIPDEPGMFAHFTEAMLPQHAHIGRWRRDIPVADHDRFGQAYREVVAGLRAEGITSVDALRP